MEAKGAPNYFFKVNVPSGPQIIWEGVGPSYMTLTNFTTNLPGDVGQLNSNAPLAFRYFAVGATLLVAQNQVTGSYSGTYAVTVSYN
jgi:hypothetical protein